MVFGFSYALTGIICAIFWPAAEAPVADLSPGDGFWVNYCQTDFWQGLHYQPDIWADFLPITLMDWAFLAGLVFYWVGFLTALFAALL